MGHYASEMSGPTTRATPKQIAQRRWEDEQSAQYRWNLRAESEAQGEWIRADETLVCPTCWASVRAPYRASHDNWHRGLPS